MLTGIANGPILAIGAHHDDNEIAAGGFLHDNSADTHLLVLAASEQRMRESALAARFLNNGMDACLLNTGIQHINDLLQASWPFGDNLPSPILKLLNMANTMQNQVHHKTQIHNGQFTDGSLINSIPQTAQFISEVIKQVRPGLIVTHSPHDAHSDHYASWMAVRMATRNYGGSILRYQSPSIEVSEFKPTVFYKMTDLSLVVKKLSVLCHASQVKRNVRYMDPNYIENLAWTWGQYAKKPGKRMEAFELVRLAL